MKDAVISQIESIRKDNNSLWMDLLRIALDKAPEETKPILAKIKKNDVKVTELFGLLSSDNQ